MLSHYPHGAYIVKNVPEKLSIPAIQTILCLFSNRNKHSTVNTYTFHYVNGVVISLSPSSFFSPTASSVTAAAAHNTIAAALFIHFAHFHSDGKSNDKNVVCVCVWSMAIKVYSTSAVWNMCARCSCCGVCCAYGVQPAAKTNLIRLALNCKRKRRSSSGWHFG